MRTVELGLEMNAARQLISWMAQSYAQMATYQDSGSVETLVNVGKANERKEAVKFETFFERPNKFKVLWTNGPPGTELWNTIVSDGQTIRQISADGQTKEYKSIDSAITEAAIKTCGGTSNILKLLVPISGVQKLSEVAAAKKLGEEAIDKDSCHVILLKPKVSPHDFIVWLSMERLNIVRIQESYVLKPEGLLESIGWTRLFSPAWWKLRYLHADLFSAEHTEIKSTSHYRKIIINQDLPHNCFSV